MACHVVFGGFTFNLSQASLTFKFRMHPELDFDAKFVTTQCNKLQQATDINLICIISIIFLDLISLQSESEAKISYQRQPFNLKQKYLK